MDKVACYLLAAVSLFHAYTHLADPLGAVEQMVGASPHKSAAALVSHCIAIIGCCHAFTGTVLLSAASMSDAAHRKCILGAQRSAAALPLLRCSAAALFDPSPTRRRMRRSARGALTAGCRHHPRPLSLCAKQASSPCLSRYSSASCSCGTLQLAWRRPTSRPCPSRSSTPTSALRWPASRSPARAPRARPHERAREKAHRRPAPRAPGNYA